MTRETKVGIVVATSFLSLIGGVLAVKYVQNRATPVKETIQAEPAGAMPGLAEQIAVASAVQYCLEQRYIALDRLTGQLVINAPGARLPKPNPTELVFGGTAPPKPADQPGLTLPGADKNEGLVINSGAPGIALAPLDAVPAKLPEQSNKPQTPDGQPLLPTPTGIVPVSGGDPPKPGADPAKDKEKKPETASTGLKIEPANTGGLVLPGTTTPTPSSSPMPVQSDPVPVPPPPPPTKPDAASKPADSGLTIPVPAAPPMPTSGMTPMPNSNDKPATVPLPAPLVPEATTPKPNNNTPVPLPLEPVPKALSGNSSPAAGVSLGQPTAGVDASGLRATSDPNNEMRLDSYEEEWYRCQAGDTLDKISQKFFYTAKYAQALRQYNLDRQYSRNLTQENAALDERQIIRIPPARVLEVKYPAAMPGYKPGARVLPTGGSNMAPTSVGFGTPNADQSDMGTAIEYKVPRANMTLSDIAKDRFGNSDQWRRIFRLNNWLNPSEPVPEGTMIFLPRDATPRP